MTEWSLCVFLSCFQHGQQSLWSLAPSCISNVLISKPLACVYIHTVFISVSKFLLHKMMPVVLHRGPSLTINRGYVLSCLGLQLLPFPGEHNPTYWLIKPLRNLLSCLCHTLVPSNLLPASLNLPTWHIPYRQKLLICDLSCAMSLTELNVSEVCGGSHWYCCFIPCLLNFTPLYGWILSSLFSKWGNCST